MNKTLWVALAGLLMGISAQAASFDCAKARTRLEKIICSNETLSKLDDLMEEDYQLVASAPVPPTNLQQRKRQWLNRRASCQTVNCLELAYEQWIVELRSQAPCLFELNTSSCSSRQARIVKLPRTADGRLMLLSENECRAGVAYGSEPKSRIEKIQVQADCVEAGFFFTCDDSDERLGDAQCAPVRLEVMERRIRRAQERFRKIFSGSSDEDAVRRSIDASQKNWVSDRETICKEMNRRYVSLREKVDHDWEVDELPPEEREGASKLGYCFVDLTYKRAGKLEEWASTLETSDSSVERTNSLLDFLSSRISR